MRTADDQARVNVLLHYSDQLVGMLVAREGLRGMNLHEAATVCEGAVVLLKKAYVAEQTNPEPAAPRFPGGTS